LAIAIDIGNTRMKAGLFKGNELLEDINLANDDIEGIQSFLQKGEDKQVILSASGKIPEGLEAYLATHYQYLKLDTLTPIPIKNTYHTPKTLGKDRVAAVIGAKVLFPDQDCLVVNAGTCITYDLINANHVYLGGNIAPGISMRLRAMDEFTAALPLVEKEIPDTDMGYSTESAIRNGAVWGTVLEIEGFIGRFSRQYPQLCVILSGGDAPILEKLIRYELKVASRLVLIGLNKIHLYNAI